MNKFVLAFIAFIVIFFACSSDKVQLATQLDFQLENAVKKYSATNDLDHFILPESNDYNNIPQDPNNPVTPVKVALGKFLFFETGLALSPMDESSKGTYSCGSCHIPTAGFRSGRMQGIADGGLGFGINGEARAMNSLYNETELDAQAIRPLSVLNVAFVTNTLWNGQFGAGNINEGTEASWTEEKGTEMNHLGLSGLETQNIKGLEIHRMIVNKEVLDELGYTPYFNSAFSDVPEDERYTPKYASFAISAYLRSMLTTKAPFQDWLKGKKDALTEQEKRGAMLFFGDAKCATCHNGSPLNAMSFYAVGVKDLYEHQDALNSFPDDKKNLGRGGFTDRAEDMYKFKVPQLYNLKDAPFYFHGSSKKSLREVVEYFNNAIPENANVPSAQLPAIFKPLNLSEDEIDDLVAFLRDGLYDPEIQRYAPEYVLSGNCFPNNDTQSRIDLDCD